MTAPLSPLAPYDPTFRPPEPRRRKVPLWVTVVLTLAGIAAASAAVFVAAVMISFSGGLDDALDVRKPTEDSKAVVAARNAAARDAGPRHAEVTAGLPGDTGVRVAKDVCDEGQHNFKTDDSYDLDCVLSRGSVHAASDSQEVARITAAVEARLAGWTAQQPTYSGTLRWTRGGPADGAAGVEEVTLTVVTSSSGLGYEIGAGYAPPGEETGVTRGGRPYPLEQLQVDHPGQLVVVTTSQRYFYD